MAMVIYIRNSMMLVTQLTLFHTQNIPCTLRMAGSLYRSSPPRIARAHCTTVLLYSSIAGTCKKNIRLTCSAVISGLGASAKSELFIFQATTPVVALQLNVAVDPSVALIDAGVLTNSAI